MKKRQGTAYFGQVHNLDRATPWGDSCQWSGPIGLRSREAADDRMPWCPDNAQPGDIVLRRMTKSAPFRLTGKIRAWGERLTDDGWVPCVRDDVDGISHDLPVSDEYYCV